MTVPVADPSQAAAPCSDQVHCVLSLILLALEERFQPSQMCDSLVHQMARKLQLPLARNSSATTAVWAAITFACIGVLAVWGMSNAYPQF